MHFWLLVKEWWQITLKSPHFLCRFLCCLAMDKIWEKLTGCHRNQIYKFSINQATTWTQHCLYCVQRKDKDDERTTSRAHLWGLCTWATHKVLLRSAGWAESPSTTKAAGVSKPGKGRLASNFASRIAPHQTIISEGQNIQSLKFCGTVVSSTGCIIAPKLNIL